MPRPTTSNTALSSWLARVWPVATVYTLATLLTRPYWLGDTLGYATKIRDGRMTEDFGHLLWYPFGWITSRMLDPVIPAMPGAGELLHLIWSALIVNWIAGLVCVLALESILQHVRPNAASNLWVCAAFIFTHAFLVVAQGGTPYVWGLAMLLLSYRVLIMEGESPDRWVRATVLAGLSMACAVSMWVPFVLVAPVAMATPVILYGFNRDRARLVVATIILSGTVTMAIFAVGALAQGITTPDGFMTWVRRSSHGISGLNGIPRTVLGFARSFIFMDDGGVLFKRFQLQDPLVPVSIVDLFTQVFWKLLVFYGFMGAFLLSLFRRPESRRMLWFWLLNAVPIILFAIAWQGGDKERYLPLYPAMFIALGYTMASGRQTSKLTVAAAVIGVLMMISNLIPTAWPVVTQLEQTTRARLGDLPTSLPPNSHVYTTIPKDAVWRYPHVFPLAYYRQPPYEIHRLMHPGTTQTETWKARFAMWTIRQWSMGGEVWVSTRVLADRPQPDWGWIEGEDAIATWSDFPEFFAQFTLGSRTGGEDGFLRVERTPQNEAALLAVEGMAEQFP